MDADISKKFVLWLIEQDTYSINPLIPLNFKFDFHKGSDANINNIEYLLINHLRQRKNSHMKYKGKIQYTINI